jgi:type I restriction enzyme S subunit
MMSNNLPKGWTIAKLGDLVITEKGKKPKCVSKVKTKECSVPYVNIKAFEKNIIDEYTDGVGCVLCEEDDFLMVWDGSRSGYVGKAIKGALGSTLVRIKLPLVNQDLTYYFLKSKFVEINSRAKGVGIPHVDPNLLWNYDFPLAPLNEQKRILAKLEQLLTDLDKGIVYLETSKQQLKVYRQAVLKWAFEGKLTNKDVKENELPKGWKWSPISDVISELNQGWSPKCENTNSTSNEEWAVIKTSAIQHINFVELENKRLQKHLTPRKQHELKNNDILITRAGPRIRVGVCCLVKNVRPKLLNCDKAYRIIADESKVLPVYLVQVLNTPRFLKIIDKCKTGGSDSGLNLTQTRFTSIEIPLPKDIEEQRRIISEIESRLSVCDKIEETIESSLQQAEALRLSIIKKAFEGKLVPQEPNDEPAEKILQRIRAAKGNGKIDKKVQTAKKKEAVI